MSVKTIDTYWFTTARGETIGIVTVKDELTGDKKAYIGVGEGHDRDADANIIRGFGSRVHPSCLRRVLELLEGEK